MVDVRMELLLRPGAEAPVKPLDCRRDVRRMRCRANEGRGAALCVAPATSGVGIAMPVTPLRVGADSALLFAGATSPAHGAGVDGGAAARYIAFMQRRVLARAHDLITHPALAVRTASPLRLRLLWP